ncbi:DUF305 domain-containing protein [Sporichthya polymorpha]|uniref:DUF305 domain-containing protein n=1 Tax=Sporichthya polymorpha TaxID=35751 RepID=UPI001FE2021C|nr:DUF305 domain-containing protein [Sporichthya polymorpha]
MVDIDPAVTSSPNRAGARRGQRWPLALCVVLLVAAAGVLLGLRLDSDSSTAPADDSAAAGFARDMQTHHAQAVEMSMIIRDRTQDPEIRTLAYDIALGQQHQIGQMFAWLQLWDLPQTGEGPRMAWAAAAHPGSGGDDGSGTTAMDHAMPGMVPAADVQKLATLRGRQAEAWFLNRMIEHHRGGVAMAEAALTFELPDDVRRLAETIVKAQSAEIEALDALLAQRTGTR